MEICMDLYGCIDFSIPLCIYGRACMHRDTVYVIYVLYTCIDMCVYIYIIVCIDNISKPQFHHRERWYHI